MNEDILKNSFITLFIISFFIDVFSIGTVGSYYITAFVIVNALFIVCGILVALLKNKIKISIENRINLIFIAYILLNNVVAGLATTTSALLCTFFIFGCILAERHEEYFKFREHIKLLSSLLNVAAIYGIYQFISRNFVELPAGDLWFEGHMYEGFNWSDQVLVGRYILSRSNAIFLEPSCLGQFMAFNIILNYAFLKKERIEKNLLWILVSFITLILSLSGTGILILVLGGSLYLIQDKSEHEFRSMFLLLIFVFMVITMLFTTSVGQALLAWGMRRSFEFQASGGNVSGYQRFIGGFSVLKYIWNNDIFATLLGTGIGSAKYYKEIYGIEMNTNTLFRIGIELGVLGIILYFIFFCYLWRNSRCNIYKRAVVCVLLPSILCGDAFTSHYIWILIYLINCHIIV